MSSRLLSTLPINRQEKSTMAQEPKGPTAKWKAALSRIAPRVVTAIDGRSDYGTYCKKIQYGSVSAPKVIACLGRLDKLYKRFPTEVDRVLGDYPEVPYWISQAFHHDWAAGSTFFFGHLEKRVSGNRGYKALASLLTHFVEKELSMNFWHALAARIVENKGYVALLNIVGRHEHGRWWKDIPEEAPEVEEAAAPAEEAAAPAEDEEVIPPASMGKCSVCFTLVTTQGCEAGHPVCASCYSHVRICPECRGPMAQRLSKSQVALIAARETRALTGRREVEAELEAAEAKLATLKRTFGQAFGQPVQSEE